MTTAVKSRKTTLRLLALSLSLVFCFSLFLPFSVSNSPVSAAENAASYTEKYVSVLLDDSGSMDAENRWEYAVYAMQMLMALLNEQDKLWITPLNKSTISVDLSNPNRNGVIRDVVQDDLPDIPSGGTQAYHYQKGVQILLDNGMKKVDGASEEVNREYWFFILSDGAFTGTPTETLVAGTVAEGYANLNVVYFSVGSAGSGSDVVDLTNTQNPVLKNSSAFSAYNVSQSSEMLSAVEDIANRISGRYSATEAEYTVSGKTVTVDLSVCGFALRNLSVMLQNTDATLKSATYNGSPMALSRVTSIVPDGALKMKNGYSAVLEAEAFLSGGTVVLEFTQEITDELVLLMEPALRVEPILYYVDAQGRLVETDSQYINSHLSAGSKICVDYRIVEEGSDRVVDPSGAFAVDFARVTYAGGSYTDKEQFSVKVGKNEIGILVSMMNGAYTMRQTIPCLIETNPSYYRVESEEKVIGSGTSKSLEAIFTVYSNNTALTEALLANYKYTVTLRDGSGAIIPASEYQQTTNNGKIHVLLPCGNRAYGDYTASLRIVSPDGYAREGTEVLSHYPASLSLTVDNSSLSLQQYQLYTNTEGFAFSLSEGADPLPFDPSYLSYSVRLGSLDVTSACQVFNGKLVFIPTAEILETLLDNPSTYPLTVSVSLKNKPSINTTANASFILLKTAYAVEAKEAGAPIDRFHISKNGASVSFTVSRDGAPMSKEALEAALASGELSVSAPTLSGVAALSVSVEEKNGVAAVVCRPVATMGNFASFFASMFFSAGDKPVTLSVGDVTETGVFPVLGFSFMLLLQYLLRIFIILLTLYIIIYAIALLVTYKSVPRLGKKTILAVEFTIDSINRVVSASRKGSPIKVGTKFTEKVMLQRLLPWNLTKAQTKSISVFGIRSTLIAEGTHGVASLALNQGTDHLKTWDCNDSANDMTLTELPAMLMKSASFNAKAQPTTYTLRYELTGDHTDTTIRQAPLGTLASPICVCSGSQTQKIGSTTVCRLVFLLD